MSNVDSPFLVADRLLKQLEPRVKVVFVDFHAEATSEKQAMGFYTRGGSHLEVGRGQGSRERSPVRTAGQTGQVLPGEQ